MTKRTWTRRKKAVSAAGAISILAGAAVAAPMIFTRARTTAQIVAAAVLLFGGLAVMAVGDGRRML